jgi:hypothetical protein
VKIARLPKVAARTGRRYGSQNRGWKVDMEHVTASTESFASISTLGNTSLRFSLVSSTFFARRSHSRNHSIGEELWRPT